MSAEIIEAPFNEDQVAALNAFQRSGLFHPFTCLAEHDRKPTLVAEADGWRCPDPDCSYTQPWAHKFMSDPEILRTMQRSWMWQAPVHGPEALMRELRTRNERIRALEDELAEMRGALGTEKERTRALRLHIRNMEKVRDLAGRPLVPEATAGDCDAVWISRQIGVRHIVDNHLPAEDLPSDN